VGSAFEVFSVYDYNLSVYSFDPISAKYMRPIREGVRFLLFLAIIVLTVAIWLVNDASSLFNNLKFLQVGFSEGSQSLLNCNSDAIMSETSLRNVIVVGGSYVGLVILAQQINLIKNFLSQANHAIST
jgi:hypothetical protein